MDHGIPQSEASVARLTCVGAKKGVKVPRFGMRTLGWHAQQPACPPYLVPLRSLVSTLQYRGHTRQVISSPMFRNRPQPPLLTHEQSVNARPPLLADEKTIQKKYECRILGHVGSPKWIFQREHPRRCRRPCQVVAAVSH